MPLKLKLSIIIMAISVSLFNTTKKSKKFKNNIKLSSRLVRELINLLNFKRNLKKYKIKSCMSVKPFNPCSPSFTSELSKLKWPSLITAKSIGYKVHGVKDALDLYVAHQNLLKDNFSLENYQS